MKERKSNFEILRIICALMIVAYHSVLHGGAGLPDTFQPNRFTSEIIYHMGELAVNCFVLISGYFLAETSFKPRKMICMLVQIEFYVIVCKLILLAFGEKTQWTLDQFFPCLTGDYWFAHAYLLLYVIQPFLKKLLLSLRQKELLSLIISQVFIWSFLPSVIFVTFFRLGNTERLPFYSRYLWITLVYIIGFYLRTYGLPEIKHDPLHIKDSKPWMIVLLPFELLLLFIILGERGLWPYSPIFFSTPNSLLMLLMSIALFYPFIAYKPRMRYSKLIRAISSCALGVYLFHDGELRSFLWGQVFKYVSSDNWLNYIRQVLVAILVIFVIGVIIEKIRQFIERTILVPIMDSIQKRLPESINSWFEIP